MRPGFVPRLAAYYAAIFIVFGIQLPFFPLWLKAKGLNAGMIGLVLALPMVVRVLAIPYATREADRRDALRAMIVLGCCASVIGYGALGLAEGALAITIVFALASLAFTPIMPLSETYALTGLATHKRSYGSVRMWGSLAYIGGTFAAGYASDAISERNLIWVIVGAIVLSAVAAFGLQPLASSAPALPEKRKGRGLLRDPVFLAVMAAASLIQSSHAVYYAFSALAWIAQGFDGTVVAALWALGVIAEIVLFAVSGRFPRLSRPVVLLLAGAVGAAVRWTAMAFDPPPLALPWLQLLHALSFGATHLGTLTFLAQHAPPGQKATAQGYMAIAMGIVMAIATGLSGLLFAHYGSRAYAAMALAAIAGGGCALIAHRLGHDAMR
jgi:PPP family 3-phenylpropionic acid transporter